MDGSVRMIFYLACKPAQAKNLDIVVCVWLVGPLYDLAAAEIARFGANRVQRSSKSSIGGTVLTISDDILEVSSTDCAPVTGDPVSDTLHIVEGAMPGPIAPIDYFGRDLAPVLRRHARKGLIASVVLDGATYVSFSDVYGEHLSEYFDRSLDKAAAWDGTYAHSWSPRRRVRARWAKPRGFQDAVRSDMFPHIRLEREMHSVQCEDGQWHTSMAAYPRHVADRAAEMFQALYRQAGFIERFQNCKMSSNLRHLSYPLSRFCHYEAEWLRIFAAEGFVTTSTGSIAEFHQPQQLMYYDMFAAKIIEDEFKIGLDPGMSGTVTVMLDGTFTHSRPGRGSAVLRPKRAS